ncbi:Eukaryotic-type DNA primase, catalytic (small) subunit [Trachipleistophora hominis]|uniref:Eukaryotic-type DNA primase, catalytic (Small) subunit n=1 Tax=Trachipleistophora hominis TaxID=72359 RepID=L7JYI2_TRAHO|nr:Eukaryotic-type DNA primase, catalytic (small) subunit [Trachipleistophora hominis]
MTDYKKEIERKHKTNTLKNKPVQNKDSNLVTQYDLNDVHVCDNLCNECIAQMNKLIDLLKKILTDNFGFSHVIFFFSGNKGFHCYVTDASARHFTGIVRQSVASYLKKHGVLVDENVTRDVKHLLKAPFCVHPKSGYVCVPVIEGVEKVHVSDVVCGNVNLERYYKYFEDFVNKMDE